MGDNVVLFTPDTKVLKPIDEAAISLLRNVLERAERGEVQGVCIATIESDGAGSVVSVGTAYAGEGVYQNVHAVLGGIEALKVRFARERLEWD